MNINRRTKYIEDKLRIFFLKYPREYFVIGFFLIFALIIIFKVFSYTVLDYDFYKELANKQQIWEKTLPVTRWTIYSSVWSGTVFWTSIDLNDLAIDPQIEWDKWKLAIFLRDIVYKQICYGQTNKICYNNMLKFLKKLEIEGFSLDEKYIKDLILNKIKEKLSKTKLTSVLLANELNDEQVSLLSRLLLWWIYLRDNTLYINPEEVLNEDLLSSSLADILWEDKADIKRRIRKRDLRYIPIINKLSMSISDEIEEYIANENQSIKQWILDSKDTIGWFIILTPHSTRLYPERDDASQIIGFLDNEWVWHYWLEWYFNDLLKWKNTQIQIRKDSLWVDINPINKDLDLLMWKWADIYTTIDRNVQKKIESLLEEWVKKYRANKWTVVVMNPMDGEIIAMANYPTFDLNNPWDVYEIEKVNYFKYPKPETDLLWLPVFVEDKERWEKFYYDSKEIFLREAKRDDLTNYALVKYKYKNDYGPWVYKNDAISSLYEPWSIMKAITVAIWIDSWEINRYDMYNDKWKVSIDEFTIKNVSDKCTWYHTFGHALNYSCNVWMINIYQKVWKVIVYNYLKDFWFWEPTNITLEWEVFSEIMPYEKWSRAKLFTSSYGLWITVTPLQMAVAYSAIVNWWLYLKPKIVKKIRFPDWKEIEYEKEVVRRVIKESTSKIVSSMLVSSINNWVAWNWKVKWYNVWWKTWTSQIAYKWKYEKWEWSTIGSFVWFWPKEEPKFVVVVKLERPRTSNYGWATSAFIFSNIAKYLFDYYGIPKFDEWNNL